MEIINKVILVVWIYNEGIQTLWWWWEVVVVVVVVVVVLVVVPENLETK